MAKHERMPAKQRSPSAAPPAGTRRVQSGAVNAARFTALSEAQWLAIRTTRDNWPDNGVDWRREIDLIGREYWEAVNSRTRWMNKLQGRKPATQLKKIKRALASIRQSEKALAALVDDGLLDDDFPHPNLSHPEHCLNKWISDYDVWVQPFAGKSNPIQAKLEWRLIELWKKSGGKVAWSRTKERGRTDTGRRALAQDVQQDAKRPNTPYAPLVDFLTLALKVILGRPLKPSGVAKVIDRHRGRRQRHDPFLTFVMRARTEVDT